MGPDRSAAAAMPSLLLLSAGREQGVPATREVTNGLTCCATSPFLEVRRILAQAMKQVWEANCAKSGLFRRCFHRDAMKAVEAGIRDCFLSPLGKDGRRHVVKLRGRLLPALRSVRGDEVNPSRFGAPLLALTDAANSDCCVAGHAKKTLLTVLGAHARNAVARDQSYYLRPSLGDDTHSVALALSSLADRGDSAPLVAQLKSLIVNPATLQHLLCNLLEVATYDETMRAGLFAVWPRVMTTVLDALDAGADLGTDRFYTERVLAHLIPHPKLKASDPKMDLTEKIATEGWLSPTSVSEPVERWIAVARGWPMCVDNAVQLIRAGDLDWQARACSHWRVGVAEWEWLAARSR